MKYHYKPFSYKKRTWPDKVIKKSPLWCSVDLRDGNQALVNPMSIEKKLKMFKELVRIGFKEIEVGFPSASKTEYDFLRTLIKKNLIPDDVTIQVLTQARKELIERTMESVIGAQRVIIHLYNSTSVAQRKMVFEKSKSEIIDIALNGVKWIKENITSEHKKIIFQYSPESFTGTEIDYSIEICQKVHQSWGSKKKIIINLPATVELFGPQIFADLIEYFDTRVKNRKNIILSIHTHNDRGTGVAASEMALLAGADRIEGTLFGNGERTGNVDIITLALNMFTHGINPKLILSDIKKIIKVSDECTEIPVPPRHPYAGDLVFTAFSGSHQDAIKKGLKYRKDHPNEVWQVPYLGIDPQDIGQTYKAIIRINSQSGKGGTSYIIEKELGYILPKEIQIEFGKVVQEYSEKKGKEISSLEIKKLFEDTYFNPKEAHLIFKKMRPNYLEDQKVEVELSLYKKENDKTKTITLIGKGNGPLDASKKALEKIIGNFKLLDYFQHSLSKYSNAQAICYLKLANKRKTHFGVGIDSNITVASVKALLSGIHFLKAKKK